MTIRRAAAIIAAATVVQLAAIVLLVLIVHSQQGTIATQRKIADSAVNIAARCIIEWHDALRSFQQQHSPAI